MEFELNVPTEPVSVSKNSADPVTDVVVQNLANFPLQLRTKLNLSNKHHGKYLHFLLSYWRRILFLAKLETEIHSQLSRSTTARGYYTGLVTVGPTKI